MPVLDDFMGLAYADRLDELAAEPKLGLAIAQLTGTPWYPWIDRPVEFIRDVLGESIWSRQAAIAEAIYDHERVAVVSGHGAGKSFAVARILAWWISTSPPGTAQAVTTAPTWRQVRNILWPYIRALHASAQLPGTMLTTEWKLGTDIVAYGMSPSEHDEAAGQGIHASRALVVLDEGGGISEARFTALEGVLSTGFGRVLAIGNPPTDDDDSPFQRRYEKPGWYGIKIPVAATPNFTGEPTGPCACPEARFRPHEIATHLVNEAWVAGVVEDYGVESNYYVARVLAEFPTGAVNRVIPMAWIEEAAALDVAPPATMVAMGVDVAADGGDELAVASCGPDDKGERVGRILQSRSGPANANQFDVAGLVKQHLTGDGVDHPGLLAVARHHYGPAARVSVRVDAIGVGWGVADTLAAWASEMRLPYDVVRVVVSENPAGHAAQARYLNKRAEMWWSGREQIKGTGPDGMRTPELRLEVDRRTRAQLWAPTYHHSSRGLIQIEAKDKMRERGVPSPDRAEALLLAMYDAMTYRPASIMRPTAIIPTRRR